MTAGAKLYSVTVRDGAVFMATLGKARLRAHIARLQGLNPSRPAFCPRFSQRVADVRARGQIVAPALRDD